MWSLTAPKPPGCMLGEEASLGEGRSPKGSISMAAVGEDEYSSNRRDHTHEQVYRVGTMEPTEMQNLTLLPGQGGHSKVEDKEMSVRSQNTQQNSEKDIRKDERIEINIKVLISGLKKLEVLNHIPSHGEGLVQGTSTSVEMSTPSSTGKSPTNLLSRNGSRTAVAVDNSNTNPLTSTLSGISTSASMAHKHKPFTTCYEILYQEIKSPSPTHINFRDWFTSQLPSNSPKESHLTVDEAKNIVYFAHLHLAENPEITRQYSITLLKKNCHLTPPAFYKLAKWSHDIRELEKVKNSQVNASNDSIAKWEAVKHCVHHRVFPSRRIVPINGNICPNCLKMESQSNDDGENGGSRTNGGGDPSNQRHPGEIIRPLSSKDRRSDGNMAAGNGSNLERSASGNSIRETKVCDNCGKNYIVLPNTESSRQLSYKSEGRGQRSDGNEGLGEGTSDGKKISAEAWE